MYSYRIDMTTYLGEYVKPIYNVSIKKEKKINDENDLLNEIGQLSGLPH